MAKNEELVFVHPPNGQEDLENIWKLQECETPTAKDDGDFVTKTLYLSVDPYLSSGLKKSALGGAVNKTGAAQVSLCVSEVIESKNSAYPVGAIVFGIFQWRRFNYFTKDSKIAWGRVMNQGDDEVTKALKEFGTQSALSDLGMPSQTAYYGAFDVGKFTKDDVLIVSGCVGAVGSVVGQIAKKVIGCKKVIGVAGGKEKCELAVKELGFDYVIDYKEFHTREKMAGKIKEVIGSDQLSAYFDNTGGHTTDAVFDVIGRKGRIVVCGQISAYNNNEDEEYTFPNYLAKTIYKALTITGYVVSDYTHQNEQEFYPNIVKWVREKKVIVKETIVEGFENTPKAYKMLFTGGNIGKIIVKL